MPDEAGVWEVRVGIHATAQEAAEVTERIKTMLCPDPDHTPPCPVPWSMPHAVPASELDPDNQYPELVEQAEIEKGRR